MDAGAAGDRLFMECWGLSSGSFEYLHLDSTCGLVWASFSMVSSVQLDCLCSGSRT